MFCDRCGANLQPGMSFCPGCGKSLGAAPLSPARGRIAGHVRLLGILWLALSVFRLLPGIVLWTVFRHGIPFLPEGIPGFVGDIIPAIGMILFTAGVVGIFAGWGLLDRQPWARMLAIILGVLNLIDMPFGTALGAYTLWVLLPAEAEKEYIEESVRAA